MTVQVIDTNRAGIVRIATGTASVLLLCTALAVPGERQQADINYGQGGHAYMMTVNTVELKSSEYIVDTKVESLAKFRFLAKQWRGERGAQSTVAAMAALPSYQKIIGMGKAALPWILAELKSEGDAPDHWFWALAAISDENPVPPESRGKLSEMANAWLAWGQKEGHVD
jgi:hypothetical protein